MHGKIHNCFHTDNSKSINCNLNVDQFFDFENCDSAFFLSFVSFPHQTNKKGEQNTKNILTLLEKSKSIEKCVCCTRWRKRQHINVTKPNSSQTAMHSFIHLQGDINGTSSFKFPFFVGYIFTLFALH